MDLLNNVIVSALIGSGAALSFQYVLSRRTESRLSRREFYVQLLTYLRAARRVMQDVAFAPDQKMPDMVPQDRIDEFNARLALDVTPKMRELTEACFRLVQQFNASYGMGVPADVNEHGLYTYRFELRQQPEETRQLAMRMALTDIYERYSAALDKVEVRARREIHGKRATAQGKKRAI